MRGRSPTALRFALGLLPALLLLAGCAQASRPPNPASETGARPPAPVRSPSTPTAQPTQAGGEASQPDSAHPPILDATYGQEGDLAYVKIPVTECANLTATPIVVGDWLVYPMHEHGRGCQNHSPYWRALFGFHPGGGETVPAVRRLLRRGPVALSP